MGWNYKKKCKNGNRKDLHRYIMEKHIGRRLKTNEFVHHIDENIHNNDISNLKIVSPAEHNRIHNIGRKHSQETIAKMRIAHTGIRCTDEARQKISIANSGKIRTDEQKERMSLAQKEVQ